MDDLEKLKSVSREESKELERSVDELDYLSHKQKADVIGGFNNLVRLNNSLVNLIDYVESGDFVGAGKKLEELEKERERVSQKVFDTFKQDLDVDHDLKVAKMEKTLEKLDRKVAEEIKEKAREKAHKEIDNKRRTVVFEEKPLQRFLKQVKEEQLGEGIETGGVFHYQEKDNYVWIDKYVPLENKKSDDGVVGKEAGMDPGDKEKELIKNSSDNLIYAHSHPESSDTLGQVDLKSHSGIDASFFSFHIDTGLGVLAAPDPVDGWIWIVPQFLDQSNWKNLKATVKTKDGEVLSGEELKNSYPQLYFYNKCVVSSYAFSVYEGEESNWLKYYQERFRD